MPTAYRIDLHICPHVLPAPPSSHLPPPPPWPPIFTSAPTSSLAPHLHIHRPACPACPFLPACPAWLPAWLPALAACPALPVLPAQFPTLTRKSVTSSVPSPGGWTPGWWLGMNGWVGGRASGTFFPGFAPSPGLWLATSPGLWLAPSPGLSVRTALINTGRRVGYKFT